MKTPRPYHRISIDLDWTGGPVGASVETWVDGERTEIVVDFTPGPFDTPADVLIRLVTIVDRQHGRQMELPF